MRLRAQHQSTLFFNVHNAGCNILHRSANGPAMMLYALSLCSTASIVCKGPFVKVRELQALRAAQIANRPAQGPDSPCRTE